MNSLTKYLDAGTFYFHAHEVRRNCFDECNAPENKSGIYLIFGINDETEKLVYIGSSGKLIGGEIKNRTSGVGGIRGRLVEGRYEYPISKKKVPRYVRWKELMVIEDYRKLRIDWFVTSVQGRMDCPCEVEKRLILLYNPSWNISVPKC